MGIGLFVFGVGFSPETIGDYRTEMMHLYDRARDPAIFGLGGLVGMIGWRMTGHQAGFLFFFRLPRVWELWAEKPNQERTPGDAAPLLKPLALGATFLTFGVVAVEWLTATSGRALSIGIWLGAGGGAAWSLYSLCTTGGETIPDPPE